MSGCDSIRRRSIDLFRVTLLSLAVVSRSLYAEPFLERLPPVPSAPLSAIASDAPEAVQDAVIPMTGPCFPAPLASGGIRTFSDVLLWKLSEGGSDNWAQEITPQGLGTSYGTATLVNAGFNWNAGFRVGIGYQRCDCDYDVSLYYTNFATRASSQASGEVYSAFLGNFYVDNANGTSFGPHYQNASMQWNFNFQTIDFEVGRTYQIDRNLAIRPFAGIKAAVIEQSMNTSWQFPIDTSSHTYGFTSAVENLKQDFWGIGPSLGVTMTMPLSTQPRYALSTFASPSGALMYGHWTFKDQYKNDGPTLGHVPLRCGRARLLYAVSSGSEVSRGGFLEDLHVQGLVRHHLLQPGVLLL
jgi:hypothetical protein